MEKNGPEDDTFHEAATLPRTPAPDAAVTVGDPVVCDFGRGWGWIADGFSMFMRQPLVWLVRRHPDNLLRRAPEGSLRSAAGSCGAAWSRDTLPRDQARSNRSRFMTLSQAATKSRTKASPESSHA